MAIQRQFCPLHADEDILGARNAEGLYEFVCERTDHPAPGPRRWLDEPSGSQASGLGGMAETLGLAIELPAALASLGSGWFEYGLVERAYAGAHTEDFATMLAAWGHTARTSSTYTATSYLGKTLGGLARSGALFYRSGRGTGRWSYNGDASFWSLEPDADWDARTTWVSVLQDEGVVAGSPEDPCHEYVPAIP